MRIGKKILSMGPPWRRAVLWPLLGAFLFSLPAGQKTWAETARHQTEDYDIDVEILTDKLDTPWGMAFLPDGSILITERDGTLRRFKDGTLTKPIGGVPNVAARGQGGLLDVAVDPDFNSNRLVYLSFSELGRGGIGTAVARGELKGLELQKVEVIYRQNIKSGKTHHFGSRLVFAKDGTLFVTHGDRGEGARAQDPFDHAGSLIRIAKDGAVPTDNPFADGKAALPEIWSTGHRNMQGATLHPESGAIWTVEHGARGGDEVNRPEPGKNYGWPVISYGRHYSGAKIGVGTAKEGLEQPRHYWDPSIAPSGLAFYDGTLFGKWRGDLFTGSLKFGMLVRLKIEDGRIVGEERMLKGAYGRIRDVRAGPDGALYLLTDDSDGMLLRLTPALR